MVNAPTAVPGVATAHAQETNQGITDVWFAIRGANKNLDVAGHVESFIDACAALEFYLAVREKQGLGRPSVIGA